jgi:hypothetical protein
VTLFILSRPLIKKRYFRFVFCFGRKIDVRFCNCPPSRVMCFRKLYSC